MNLIESVLAAKTRRQAPIIAEVKRLIPKLADEEGRQRDERSAASLAQMYQKGGAIGISLVTEETHFGGQPEEDIPAVLRNTSLPLLLKDFILDRERVDYYVDIISRSGKDQVGRVALLLTTHIAGERTPSLLDYFHSKGLLALVETRSPEDLAYLGAGQSPRLVGVNNKNIDELEKGQDLVKVTSELVGQYRERLSDFLLIGQSAYRRPEDVRRSLAAGVDAILVGTAFMTAPDPTKVVASFVYAMDGGE